MSSLKELTLRLNNHNIIDDNITKLNKQVHLLRQERNNLESQILKEMTELNLGSKKLKFNNISYSISTSKNKPGLTLDLIKEISNRLFGEEQTHLLLNSINRYRETNKKTSYVLKHKKISQAKKKSYRKSVVKSETNQNNNNLSLKKKLLE